MARPGGARPTGPVEALRAGDRPEPNPVRRVLVLVGATYPTDVFVFKEHGHIREA